MMFRARRATRVFDAVAYAVLSAVNSKNSAGDPPSHKATARRAADATAQRRISRFGERTRRACWIGGLAETIFYAINRKFATLQQPFGQRPERSTRAACAPQSTIRVICAIRG